LRFFWRYPSHTNHFPVATLAGRYGNGGARNLQEIREEFDAGFIRPAIDRRRGYRELESIANFTGDGILPGTRMDFHGEGHAGWGLLDKNQLELEVSTIGRSARAVVGAGGWKHTNNPSQTFPGRLIQCRVRANEVANHIPCGNIQSAFWRRSHGQRDRALRTEANPLGR
jgi:hypothetical protein